MTQEEFERAKWLKNRIDQAERAIHSLNTTYQHKAVEVYSNLVCVTSSNELFGENVFFQALLDFYISQRDKAQEEFDSL
jgi:hypothetical protein